MNQSSAIGKDFFLQLSKEGSKLNLSFSGYEVLNNMIMALDGINRKMLLMHCNDITKQPVIIPLSETLNVSVKKTYSGIPAGSLRHKSLETFIDKIVLEFEMSDNPSKVMVPVFDAAVNQPDERVTLEKKARNWQRLLMKLSGRHKRKEAKSIAIIDSFQKHTS